MTTAARTHPSGKSSLFERIGERIRAAREEKGYTQEDLGKLIDQSAVTVSRWESASRRPGITELVGLAQELDKPITYFTEEKPPEEGPLVQLTRTIHELDERDRQELEEYAEFRRRRHVERRLKKGE